MLDVLIASIPAPPFSELGPFRLYGLCIAIGVVAAVMISSDRWADRGGDPDDIGTIAIWAVPAGVIGSRIYHVATDWKTYQDDWLGAFKIWNGGLGIPGGIFFGVLVGLLVVRAKGLPKLTLLDIAAPAIPVAQAIGRLGNYFNQEVFGRASTLPWALEVDPEFRPAGSESAETFHPTFLYEALWNLALAFLLVRLDRKRKLRPGQIFTLYVLGYAVGRLWVEMLRADPASLILGIRINIWMSAIVGLLALAVFVRNLRRPAPEGYDTAPRPGDDGGDRAGVEGDPDAGAGDEDEDEDEDEEEGGDEDEDEGGGDSASDASKALDPADRF